MKVYHENELQKAVEEVVDVLFFERSWISWHKSHPFTIAIRPARKTVEQELDADIGREVITYDVVGLEISISNKETTYTNTFWLHRHDQHSLFNYPSEFEYNATDFTVNLPKIKRIMG